MTHVNSSSASNRQSETKEQIDLIDLLMQLWRGKTTIALFIVIAILLAVAYLFVAKEKWTSEAIVTLPDSGQIANYNNSMGILYGQNPTNAPTVVDVQERFFGRFNSAISALSEQLQNKSDKESLKIEQTVKGQEVPLTISYTAPTAEQAQKTLDKYIQLVNRQVVKELDDDLTININSKLEDLKASLATQIRVAQEQKDKRLAVLNQALIVAQQAGIKDTLVQQAETLSEDTLFVLGSDALSSIIKNEGTRPLPLSDYYYQTRQTLLAISALKSKPDSIHSFRYVMQPSLPVYRDTPKRGLTLILAVLLGGIIGSSVVLIRTSLRSRHIMR